MRRGSGLVAVGAGAAAALAVTCLVPAAAHPASGTSAATAAQTTRFPNLSFGMRQPAVTTLQSRLGMPVVTGYFGLLTRTYVQRVQQNAGIGATGVVDRRTWRAVNRRSRAVPAAPRASGASPVLGTHASLGSVAAPMTRFRDGGHAYYKFNGRLHSCRYLGKCLDLNGAIGQPVFAMADGQLKTPPYAARSYGKFVTITHRDGTESIYAHLNSVTGKAGWVTAGMQIGTVGCSGTSGEPNGCQTMAPHLHLEWSGLHWKSGEYGELPPFFDRWRGNPPRCYQGC